LNDPGHETNELRRFHFMVVVLGKQYDVFRELLVTSGATKRI
jgi:hypothetical protein